MSADPDFLGRVRSDLVRAAGRGQAGSSRARRIAAVAAAVVVVLVLGAAYELRSAPAASAGVSVTTTNNEVTVRLTNLEHRPDVIEKALRKAGFDARVVAAPAGPSLVGRFLAGQGSGALPPDLRPVGGGPDAFSGFVLPAHWSGRLALRVGRPAHEGERYARFTDAYAAGEPLHCSGIYGLDAASAARKLPRGTASFEFEVFASPTSGPAKVAPAAIASSPYASYIVSDAIALSANEVRITITPGGASPRTSSANSAPPACTP